MSRSDPRAPRISNVVNPARWGAVRTRIAELKVGEFAIFNAAQKNTALTSTQRVAEQFRYERAFANNGQPGGALKVTRIR